METSRLDERIERRLERGGSADSAHRLSLGLVLNAPVTSRREVV